MNCELVDDHTDNNNKLVIIEVYLINIFPTYSKTSSRIKNSYAQVQILKYNNYSTCILEPPMYYKYVLYRKGL
jgi:hypothetical protein